MPLRSELFSADQMEHHGTTLANWHKLSPNRGPDRLLSRLSENEQILTRTCDLLTETIKADRPVTLAGEWLLDNFYLIEEQFVLPNNICLKDTVVNCLGCLTVIRQDFHAFMI